MDTQLAICTKFGAPFVPSPAHLKVGIARNVRQGLWPLNGLRHRPEEGTSGWFIWAGEELSQDADFFVPVHVAHLDQWCPQVVKYLGLAPGWRFLIAPDYEDVWHDAALLHVNRDREA